MSSMLNHPRGAYYFALGRFIHHFAKIEDALLALLWHESGVPDAVARAIFTGFRLEATKDAINRCRSVAGKKEDATLKRAFAQLTVINASRNLILHYEPETTRDWQEKRSNWRQRLVGNETELLVSPEMLEQMIQDLQIIKLAMVISKWPDRDSEQARKQEMLANQGWQYKP